MPNKVNAMRVVVDKSTVPLILSHGRVLKVGLDGSAILLLIDDTKYLDTDGPLDLSIESIEIDQDDSRSLISALDELQSVPEYYEVKLTYFRPTGKYYSSGVCYSNLRLLGDLFTSIRNRVHPNGVKFESMPGLTSLGDDFIIHVDPIGHPHRHPAVIQSQLTESVPTLSKASCICGSTTREHRADCPLVVALAATIEHERVLNAMESK